MLLATGRDEPPKQRVPKVTPCVRGLLQQLLKQLRLHPLLAPPALLSQPLPPSAGRNVPKMREQMQNNPLKSRKKQQFLLVCQKPSTSITSFLKLPTTAENFPLIFVQNVS